MTKARKEERKTVFLIRSQELCESRGGRPGLPVPNSPYGLCRRKATVEEVVFLVLHVSEKTKCSAGQLSFNLYRGLHFCLSLGLQKLAWLCTQCSFNLFS